MKLKPAILALAVASLGNHALQAVTFSWNNAGTDWATASNWSAAVPTATDIASFNPQSGSGAAINIPVIAGTGNVASALNLNNNFLGGAFSFSGTGTLTLGSGGVTVRGYGTQTINGPILAGAAAGNLTFNIGNNAGLTLSGATTATTNSGAITVNGGTFTVDNSTSTTAKLNGNVVNLTSGGTFSLVGNAAGTTLNLGNLPTGNNTVSGLNTFTITPNGTATTINFANSGAGLTTRPGTRGAYQFVTTSGNLGDTNGARVTFAGTPYLGSNGLLSNTSGGGTFGYATVKDAGGVDFATWNSTNGVVRAGATITTAGSTTPSVFGTSSDRVQFNPAASSTTTPTGAIAPGSLRITPAGASATLAMGSNNITSNVLMLDGSNDFTIAGTGTFANSGTRYIYVNNATTTLRMSQVVDSGANPTVFVGPGIIELTGTTSQNTNTDTSRFSIAGGVVRGNDTEIGFASGGTRGVVSFGGGVLEIKNGANGTGASADFTRAAGSTAGSVTWGASGAEYGSGGFSAYGAAASVNIGGTATPATLTWGTTASFVADGFALKFGSSKSNAVLTFLNPIALDGGTAGTYAAREINVTAGAGGDKTVLAGVISGSISTDLIKTGTGALGLGAANSYAGNTILAGGNLVLSNASGLGTGTLNIGIGSNLDGGSGFTGGTSGNRNTGAALNTVALTGAVSITNNMVLPVDTALNTRSIHTKGGTGNSTNFSGTISGGSTNLSLFLNNDVADNLGIVRFSGANTFTTSTGSGANSGINLNRGSLQIDSNAALGNSANSLFLDSYAGQKLIFANAMTYTHPTTLGTAATFDTGANNVDASGIGAIGGAYTLTKAGSGTLTLGGNYTYTSAANLVVSVGAVSTTGRLNFNATTTGYASVSGAGTLNLRSTTSNASAPDISFNDNDVDNSATNYGTFVSTPVDLGSSQRYIWGRTNHSSVSQYGPGSGGTAGADIQFNGSISGSGGMTFVAQDNYTGSSPMETPFVLNAANTFTGPVEVQRGSVYLTAANALTQGNALTLDPSTGNNSRLFLYGNNASVSNLTSNGAGTSVIANGNLSSGAYLALPATTLTVNQTADTTFAGTLVNAQTEYNKTGANTQGALSLTKTGGATLTLTGANTYTGGTNVNAGTLVINGNQSGATGAVTVAGGATLKGAGTVGGATTINGTHAPGVLGTPGQQTFYSTLNYGAGSIFEWDLNASASNTGTSNQGTYGQVVANGTVSGTSVFNVVLGSNSFSDAFWDTNKTWSNIFAGTSAPANLASIFTTFGGTNVASDGTVAGQGAFTFNGSNTLTWTAVPEPTTALAGLLLGAGLLRRRRK